jgi:hypothetical protein
MDAEETAFFAEIDPMLRRIIVANPGLRPNELASLALAEIDPMGDAPEAVAFGARRTIRNRAADLLGVEPEPACMDADEARLAANIAAGGLEKHGLGGGGFVPPEPTDDERRLALDKFLAVAGFTSEAEWRKSAPCRPTSVPQI